MQLVLSCFHCQFQCHVLKALFVCQNSPKTKLFLQKNAKFSPPPHPQNNSPYCQFLATRLHYSPNAIEQTLKFIENIIKEHINIFC